MTEPLDKPHTFEMLDVIRGLAAIMVAEGHLAHYFFDKQMPGRYLAVDVFFVLSGFVLAHAYEPRFAQGLRAGRFLTIRLIRLYPLYLVGFLLGLLNLWLTDMAQHVTLLGYYLPFATVFAMLFLPLMIAPVPNGPGTLYPLDHPAWTLLFELFANLLHAMIAPRLTNKMLHVIILVSGAALIGVTMHFGYLDVGYRIDDFAAGVPRVCFSYFLGVRLYRSWCERAEKKVAGTWAILAALIALLLLPVPQEWRACYDLVAVLVLIPTLIYHAASVNLRGVGRWLLPLGAASYAYYVLHVPFGLLCATLAARAGFDLTALAEPLGGVLVMGALLGLCLLLDHVYDRPVRRFLTARVLGRRNQRLMGPSP